MAVKRKVIVIGLDGLEPTIVSALLARGDLPNLSRIASQGGFSCVRTTVPAQTPVAWSTFATGLNPGGHGIFDFIRRNPKTYLPDLALNRYEQKNTFLPPRAVNLRGGTAVWQVLSDAGVPSTVLRCPCTYPPDSFRGRMLSGMGVPDLRGGLGTSTFYSSADDLKDGESEQTVKVTPDSNGTVSTHVVGPRNPRSGATLEIPLTIRLDPSQGRIVVMSDGDPKALEVRLGHWSDWLKVRFKAGPLQSVRGMVRFHLVELTPAFKLYASPLNFDTNAPLFPISSPGNYAHDLTAKIGQFYTTGMVEDHTGLSNGRFDELAYLDQCNQVLRERERMMTFELERHREGFFFCLFDTPDRIQHMFWRFREPEHPANRFSPANGLERVIEDHYRDCDGIVGRAMEAADDKTLFVVLSDHGFGSFQRGLNLNTWLHQNGFLALKKRSEPGDDGELLKHVDWSRTTAYALGLGSIYVNVKGREGEGIVEETESAAVKASIAGRLTGLVDRERGDLAVRSVSVREQIYRGNCLLDAPDLVVGFAPGYRVSWATALGGVPRSLFEDNVKKWSGDHIIDSQLVPGALFMSDKFRPGGHLTDLAPTILSALGVPKGPDMEGEALLI